MGARPRAEDFEDQSRSIDDLGLPAPFEIALLHRAQRGIDDNDPDLVLFDEFAQIFDGAAAEQAARPRAVDTGDFGRNHIEPDGLGKANGFVEPRFGRPL